jgi:hypothetical protein
MGVDLSTLNDAQKSLIAPKDRRAMKLTTPEERREKWEAGQEKELQQLISNWLAQQGDAVYVESDAFGRKTSGKAGRPDFRICYRGRWLAVEVKTSQGRLSPAQVATLEKVRKAGGIAIVAFGLDAVRDALRAIDGEAK